MSNYIIIDGNNYLLPPFVVETLGPLNLEKINSNNIDEQERYLILKRLEHFLSSYVCCLDDEQEYFKGQGISLTLKSDLAKMFASNGEHSKANKKLYELIIFHGDIY